MGNVLGEEGMCRPSRMLITCRKNTGPKAEPTGEGGELTWFCGSKVLLVFIMSHCSHLRVVQSYPSVFYLDRTREVEEVSHCTQLTS